MNLGMRAGVSLGMIYVNQTDSLNASYCLWYREGWGGILFNIEHLLKAWDKCMRKMYNIEVGECVKNT